ncbi:hypothetical protein J6590_028169 [Homalodisca vitripennis]|nr:hypothetical protein J6590_028169 [Homalodisca vitripennis]
MEKVGASEEDAEDRSRWRSFVGAAKYHLRYNGLGVRVITRGTSANIGYVREAYSAHPIVEFLALSCSAETERLGLMLSGGVGKYVVLYETCVLKYVMDQY